MLQKVDIGHKRINLNLTMLNVLLMQGTKLTSAKIKGKATHSTLLSCPSGMAVIAPRPFYY